MLKQPQQLSRALWGICLLATITAASAGLLAGRQHPAAWMLGLYTSRHLVNASGYGLAVFLCSRIQADYPAKSRMRLAWQLMTASCALAVVRYVFDWIAAWGGAIPADLVSLRQIPIALTLLLLTSGLVAMLTSFAAVGLGARFRPLDLLGFAATAACVPFVFSLRDGMADAHSGFAFIRYIQAASPLLLAAPALVALALHRISHEMGQGTLAVSLRLLTLSLIIRLAGLWIASAALGRVTLALVLGSAFHAASTWIFAQAVFQRWRLTVQAATLAERYQRDPASEIAELSRRIVART